MKTPYFLYVGNAYPHKNLDTLFRAFETIGEARLVLVGKDDFFYKRLRESNLAKQLGDRILFKMKVSDRELGVLYQNAQAFVFPSFMEGFGLPALEALANNCPVIVSDIPVFHEILGSSATYFDPYRVDGLAKILKSAVKKRLPVDSNILKNYSWQKMAKETLSVYENSARVRSCQ
jgi:glycosyltransferase involved in cell wall biosynthesis